MASLPLSLPTSSGRHLPIFRSVRCANERQAMFSRIAPVYDNLNDLLSLGQHRIWKRMAVSWSGAKKGDCVLDLCCGSGDLAFLLSEKVGFDGKGWQLTRKTWSPYPYWDGFREVLIGVGAGFGREFKTRLVFGPGWGLGDRPASSTCVTGLDFSKEQLLVASSRQHIRSKACYKNIEWVEGDALDLPFSDCYFDAISIGYGLRNVVDKRKAMQEMFRVLKPGSKVSALDFNKSTQPFTASIQEWMVDNVVVPVATGYGLAKEYEYLKSSIRDFLTGKELEKLALEAGFSTAKHYEIGGGLMGNLVATR